MRILTYRSDRGTRAGLLVDGAVVDVWDALGGDGSSVRELLEADRLGELRGIDAGGSVALEDVELLPPVPDPEKIVCIGLNYRAHAAEAGIDPPDAPAIFGKYRNALVPTGAEVDESTAADHIAGYTLLNDLSARDLQFATPQWMPGKVFDGSAPCGPALVTADEALTDGTVSFSLTLNDEVMQDASTDDLIFGIPQLVAHLSRLMTLEPGDIVSTGTPSGVGSTRDPRVWLRPGDEIAISSPTLGLLETRIA
jgi:2-keto-4-pentenoate hydratase/2-oxohepta-3-ene-1,7-dioic acid hydratase in catechol pathway